MNHTYVIIDDDHNSVLKTRAIAARFQNMEYVGSANNYNDGLDLILQTHPTIVFLEIDPSRSSSNLSLQLINELYRYLNEVPKVIVTTKDTQLALDAIRYEVLDYYTKPFEESQLRRTLFRFEKAQKEASQFIENHNQAAGQSGHPTIFSEEPELEQELRKDDTLSDEIQENTSADAEAYEILEVGQHDEPELEMPAPIQVKPTPEEKSLIICVKSYGDYRFIEAKDICYLQADNNSTDIHLNNGEMITAFKTLKHFETVLSAPFVRIHNSYIVNIDYVSRIHTGNAVCYIKNTITKLPFSKSYKENVDEIINTVSKGNYLEI
jgi:DNA-binding LytR/AlgR family response regulator